MSGRPSSFPDRRSPLPEIWDERPTATRFSDRRPPSSGGGDERPPSLTRYPSKSRSDHCPNSGHRPHIAPSDQRPSQGSASTSSRIPTYADVVRRSSSSPGAAPYAGDIVCRRLPEPSKPQHGSNFKLSPPRAMDVDVEAEETAAALSVHQASSQPSSQSVLQSSRQRSKVVVNIEMVTDFGMSPPRSSPGSPTSPPYSPSSPQDATGFFRKMPQCDVHESDDISHESYNEDPYSSEEEDDPCFNSLVDNFITASTSVGLPTSSPDIDYAAANERQSVLFAESALKYYNSDEKNKIKYELIRVIKSSANLDRNGYGHVNFIAKGDFQNSKEELFFAEVRLDFDVDGYIPTCMVSLEGKEQVGGYRDIEVDYPRDVPGLPVDKQHCYFCGDKIKHPEDGTLYESGHVALFDYYDYDL